MAKDSQKTKKNKDSRKYVENRQFSVHFALEELGKYGECSISIAETIAKNSHYIQMTPKKNTNAQKHVQLISTFSI